MVRRATVLAAHLARAAVHAIFIGELFEVVGLFQWFLLCVLIRTLLRVRSCQHITDGVSGPRLQQLGFTQCQRVVVVICVFLDGVAGVRSVKLLVFSLGRA
jgi:hypothetical protein